MTKFLNERLDEYPYILNTVQNTFETPNCSNVECSKIENYLYLYNFLISEIRLEFDNFTNLLCLTNILHFETYSGQSIFRHLYFSFQKHWQAEIL